MIDLQALNLLAEQLPEAHKAAERAEDVFASARAFPRGLLVRVVKGRKVPVGTEFVVQQAGDGRYGSWVRTPEGAFVDRGNVEIIDPAYEALRAAASAAHAAESDLRDRIAAAKRAVVEYAGINLRSREDVQHHSYGWREDDEYTTPCNPEATDEEIRLALRYVDPEGSSWGSLRWSCGTDLRARLAPDRIRVYSSTGLAD